MSAEFRARYTSGNTLYAVLIKGSNGQVYNGSSFENPTAANWTTYAVTMTEQSTTGLYYGNFPSSQAAGRYDVLVVLRAGGSAATTDALVAQAAIDWTGTAELSLAAISLKGALLRTAITCVVMTSLTVAFISIASPFLGHLYGSSSPQNVASAHRRTTRVYRDQRP